MKKLILLFILTLTIIRHSYAKCADSSTEIWPSKEVISLNSLFIITAYGDSRELINGLDNRYLVYLKSDNEKISLKVTEVLTGDFMLKQAVFIPVKPLRPNTSYELVIDFNPKIKDLSVLRNIPFDKNNVKAKWKTSAINDITAPKWDVLPKEINKVYQRLGCGPSSYVDFNCNVTESEPFVIKTTVKNTMTGKITTFYIEPTKDLIRVGYGMCAGEFFFYENKTYEVSFSLMDSAGNTTSWNNPPITFVSPAATI